ncbi:MAG: hypothetical protein ACRDSR_15215 [Pseudonocardiaceae bacterium]
MLRTGFLLLVAVCLLVASLGTDQVALAWGSVVLSALVAVMIIMRWRQRRNSLEPPDTPHAPGPVEQLAVPAGTDHVAEDTGLVDVEGAEPGEEDTDAADLLVVYELADQVLVVDEHPRYHLTGCPWPDQAQVERLAVREARELGFTPCDRCRPDTSLARRHRSTSASTSGS